MKIYHYTTIETLALILKNKTIRFNRLDQVDDAEESMYSSGNTNMKLGKYAFVSCWTRRKEENLSLWNMYTDSKGVRIGLEEKMFPTYRVNDKFESFFSSWLEFKDDCLFPLPSNEAKLNDVIYVPDVEEKVKDFIKYENETITITPGIALYKRREWEYQAESRFVLIALPISNKNIYMKRNDNIVNNLCNLSFASEY